MMGVLQIFYIQGILIIFTIFNSFISYLIIQGAFKHFFRLLLIIFIEILLLIFIFSGKSDIFILDSEQRDKYIGFTMI